MSDLEDQDLVRRFKNGEDDCFDRIYDKYKVPIYSICYRYTRNGADASELTQDVFIKIYRNLHGFNERAKLFTWIYRITVNACISFKRRERNVYQALPVVSHGVPLGERITLKKAIDDALQRLPPRQRLAFILRHNFGYSFDEIGGIMGITAGAAKANHHQAVKKMRRFLKDWL
ncbi:MAG: sigma-70 family RNA polymerase sigma factor [candidate division WOR-3 bacterium]|nr:MAG: sigma-70 family RNA polymerase sigma factor [candidate division WOR-3 bacterium]